MRNEPAASAPVLVFEPRLFGAAAGCIGGSQSVAARVTVCGIIGLGGTALMAISRLGRHAFIVLQARTVLKQGGLLALCGCLRSGFGEVMEVGMDSHHGQRVQGAVLA